VTGSTRGRLLLATPELLDPNFARAVLLMIEHSVPLTWLGVIFPARHPPMSIWSHEQSIINIRCLKYWRRRI